MSKLINDLVGKQCIIRSEFIFSFIRKNFDYPEKPLKYKHIRRISD